MLILLLFVLTGSLDGVPFQGGDHGVQTLLTQSAESDTSDTVRNTLSAWTYTFPCDFSVETPVVSFNHKALVRLRAAVRSAVDGAFGVRMATCRHTETPEGDAVDYYVYSLGRLLI